MDPVVTRHGQIQRQLTGSYLNVTAAILVLAEAVGGLMTDGVPVTVKSDEIKVRLGL